MSALSILASNHDEYITGDLKFIKSFDPSNGKEEELCASLSKVKSICLMEGRDSPTIHIFKSIWNLRV